MFALCLLVIVVVVGIVVLAGARRNHIRVSMACSALCFCCGLFFLGLSFFFSADLCLPQLFGPKVVDRGPPLAMPANGEHIRNCKGAAQRGGEWVTTLSTLN